MNSSQAEACKLKPHAVCIPAPFQSHINAMLQLAKLLHYKGFRITFVNTEFNQRRLLKSRSSDHLHSSSSSSEYGFPDFQFETIPDGVSSSEENAIQDTPSLPSLGQTIRDGTLLEPFRLLLAKLNDTTLVTCIISDGFLAFTIKAAKEIGVPIAMFFTVSAGCFMTMKQLRTIKERGLTLSKDNLDTVVDWIPGMSKNLRIRDFPSNVRTIDPDDIIFNMSMEAAEEASKATAIVIHTFEALELQLLDALKTSMFSHRHLLPIGPLHLLLKKTHCQVQDPGISSLGGHLWKPETECLHWLDAQEPSSVIYVNFGSLTVVTKEQVVELGMGLVNSGHPFLWIIRPDLVAAGNSAVLQAEFVEEINKRGFISSWCPQEEVLNHRAVGGFLTHCGWNSTLESLCAGVPMICWPFDGDQLINSRYACAEWGIGVEVSGEDDDGFVKRDKIEEVVRDLMEGEKGHEMKKKAMEWKKMAEEATATDGYSSLNLEKLLNHLLLTLPQ